MKTKDEICPEKWVCDEYPSCKHVKGTAEYKPKKRIEELENEKD